jgi:predicted nucleic acid-binding protein
MRIIISDTSCLIDLRKADLLSATLALAGFHVQVALPLARDELSSFAPDDWERLTDQGLEIVDLEPRLVARSLELKRVYRRLSAYDVFSLALASDTEEAVLLTSDRALRAAANAEAVEAHGVLWVVDRLEENGLLPNEELFRALSSLQADPLVFLPQDELQTRLARFARREQP